MITHMVADEISANQKMVKWMILMMVMISLIPSKLVRVDDHNKG
jgi:hypothetical protein